MSDRDLFFRKAPDGASFAIANGVKQCAEYLANFKFTQSDIDYLKSLNLFSDAYLNYLKDLRSTGDMWGIEDGTVVFGNEPCPIVNS